MEKPTPEKVPLTPEERSWLMYIYRKRLKSLWIGFFGNTVILTIFSFTYFGFKVYACVNDLILDGKDTWMVDQNFLSGWYIKIGIAAVISVVFCALSYLSSMLPYRMDADSGMKLRVPYRVTRKEYFPITGQCFVSLSGIRKHFEVDAETYQKCEEDGIIYMDQAALSRYIFSENNEFKIFSF